MRRGALRTCGRRRDAYATWLFVFFLYFWKVGRVARFASKSSVLAPNRVPFTPVDVNIVTISKPSPACKPGLSNGSEWCTSPVLNSTRLPCKFHRWQDLYKLLGGHQSYNVYRKQFEIGGRIGIQQDAQRMTAIYTAHLNALRELCARHGGQYGLVLEGDVDLRSPIQSFRPRKLATVMAKLPDVSVFNFGPTTPICRNKHRFHAYLKGECFVPHHLGVWGAVAVGYNLSTACSESFLSVQDALKGCVPSDVGLFSGAGGYRVVDSTLPIFAVKSDIISSNSADDIHMELRNTYNDNLKLWNELKRADVDCDTVLSSPTGRILQSQSFRCDSRLRLVHD